MCEEGEYWNEERSPLLLQTTSPGVGSGDEIGEIRGEKTEVEYLG